jgi:very-short-patch-repair endonuclease
VLQLADWHGVEAGMVAAEAGLHQGSITKTGLQLARRSVRLGRGRANADLVLQLASDRSESPGETLTRLLLRSLQLPVAQQQVRIPLPWGGVARVDFLLPDLGVVVEFDGAVKYEGAQGRSALVREKRREDGIRAAGYPVVRLTWPDLGRPARVHEMLLRAASSRQ